MIDWDRLRELCDEIGEEDYAEVVELFFLEADVVIERLRQSGTPAEREADLHALKGSALNLGFTALGALCETGERRAVDGTLENRDVEEVIETYRSSRKALEAGCASAA